MKNADKSAVRFSEDRHGGLRLYGTYRIVLIDDGVDVDHGGDWAKVPKMVLEPRADLGVIWASEPRPSKKKICQAPGATRTTEVEPLWRRTSWIWQLAAVVIGRIEFVKPPPAGGRHFVFADHRR